MLLSLFIIIADIDDDDDDDDEQMSYSKDWSHRVVFIYSSDLHGFLLHSSIGQTMLTLSPSPVFPSFFLHSYSHC
jgi:hypothetical protein